LAGSRRGALFWAGAVFPADAVTVTGETRAWNEDRFCPRCAEGAVYPERLLQAASRRGSHVVSRFGDETEVHLGALDGPDRFSPTYECWTVRREGWLPAFAGVREYARDREGGGREE